MDRSWRCPARAAGRGAVIVGFFAAIMSSIASTFNSAATLVTMDLVSPRLPNADSARLMRAGRIATIVFMVLAVAWAPQIWRFESLWQYVSGRPALARRECEGRACVHCLRPAGRRGAVLCERAASTPLDLDFLYVAPLLFALSAIVLVAVSAASAPPSLQQVGALLWTPAFYRDENPPTWGLPWWQNYRVLSVLLLMLTAVIVWSFR